MSNGNGQRRTKKKNEKYTHIYHLMPMNCGSRFALYFVAQIRTKNIKEHHLMRVREKPVKEEKNTQ